MELNAATVQAANTAYRAIFLEGMGIPKPVYKDLCDIMPTSTGITNLEIVDILGGMREWIGEREIGNLKHFEHTIKPKDFEQTVKVSRNAVEDDQLGIYNRQFKAMGVNAARHPDLLLIEQLNGGFANKTWDSKTFFATNHKSGSNKVAGALSTTTFATAKKQLRLQKRMDGQDYINVLAYGGKLKLYVAPDLEAAAEGLVNAQFNSDGSSNIHYKAADLEVLPGLEAGYWFLTVSGGALKPFIFLDRKKPEFIAHDDPATSEALFMRKELVYGVDMRCSVAYGFHQLIQGSTGT